MARRHRPGAPPLAVLALGAAPFPPAPPRLRARPPAARRRIVVASAPSPFWVPGGGGAGAVPAGTRARTREPGAGRAGAGQARSPRGVLLLWDTDRPDRCPVGPPALADGAPGVEEGGLGMWERGELVGVEETIRTRLDAGAAALPPRQPAAEELPGPARAAPHLAPRGPVVTREPWLTTWAGSRWYAR